MPICARWGILQDTKCCATTVTGRRVTVAARTNYRLINRWKNHGCPLPLHDYSCAQCGAVLLDQYRSVQVGAQATPPICCEQPMVWHPAVGRVDLFQPFSCFDGRNRPVVIDSLHKLRQVERESEKLEADGLGASMHWRMWSQDASNRLVNTHGPDPSEAPSEAGKRRFSPFKHGATEPDRTLGPGVTESTTSPLEI